MKYYVVDAFAEPPMLGNPAGVCLPDRPLDEVTMQAIAAENNLAETAFVVPDGDGYGLRWFTPTVEVDLCGHATLASAFIISQFVEPGCESVRFATKSGPLAVRRDGDLFELDFPARPPKTVAVRPEFAAALGCDVAEAHLSRDMMLVVRDEATVRGLEPDIPAVAALPDGFGVIVTARGDQADFVSRFFVPKGGVPEDPVTGSTHTTLIPFWAARLGKPDLVAHQLSRRGGVLYCHDRGDRVGIAGRARLYLTGEISPAS